MRLFFVLSLGLLLGGCATFGQPPMGISSFGPTSAVAAPHKIKVHNKKITKKVVVAPTPAPVVKKKKHWWSRKAT